MIRGASCAAVAVAFFFATGGVGQADFYRYKDDSGTVNYTNDPTTIPKHLRKKAVVVSKDLPQTKVVAPPSAAAVVPAAEPVVETAPVPPASPSRYGRFGGTAASAAAFLVLFIFAGKLALRFGWGGGVKILRAAAVSGLLAYLAFTHLHDILATFGKVRGSLESLKPAKTKQPLPEESAEVHPPERGGR